MFYNKNYNHGTTDANSSSTALADAVAPLIEGRRQKVFDRGIAGLVGEIPSQAALEPPPPVGRPGGETVQAAEIPRVGDAFRIDLERNICRVFVLPEILMH